MLFLSLFLSGPFLLALLIGAWTKETATPRSGAGGRRQVVPARGPRASLQQPPVVAGFLLGMDGLEMLPDVSGCFAHSLFCLRGHNLEV